MDEKILEGLAQHLVENSLLKLIQGENSNGSTRINDLYRVAIQEIDPKFKHFKFTGHKWGDVELYLENTETGLTYLFYTYINSAALTLLITNNTGEDLNVEFDGMHANAFFQQFLGHMFDLNQMVELKG